MEQLLEKFRHTYQIMDKDSIDLFDEVYASNLTFIDPFHHINGLTEFKVYLKNMYNNVSESSFSFKESISNGNHNVTEWTMSFKHPKINRGKTIQFDGITLIKVAENKIYYHRDYFDAGAMLYEHIPLLGKILQRIKRGLA